MEYYQQIGDNNAVEPISLDEAKWHLRILNTDEDVYISKLVASARTWAESYTNRDWKSKEYELTISEFKNEFEIRKYPLLSVDTFTLKLTDDTTKTLVEGTDFLVFPQESDFAAVKMLETYDVADVPDAMKIHFTTGAAIIDEDATAGMLLKIGSLYDIRIDTKKQYQTAAENLLFPHRLSSML